MTTKTDMEAFGKASRKLCAKMVRPSLLRIVASIHWGQGKEAAELDCQRRLREMGR